ncbi:hypothetical protein [Bacillus pseudomycoides]|uniref:hypothetical protein n=1 Tax=Bacillus pseudomycoides TaxID=64104 RepID=UPI0001A1494D|nr:hypothetical protein [Bacillus pseudomycoides]EEM07830.1 hypothetical protein bmyco0003_54880 [Bacillus pseudomycoides]PDZ08185.1 hypothetical protein CON70_29205 [Bacillus pseudomycoides]PDZ70888.1 hypothetical protein CON58_26305 [Bacillus pseudomycoides]PEE36596.1 hypothetical protein COO02_25845 [Bacillus pseudomycoides]PEF21206.1 hypothetical protein CON69_29270 [Bacillus pseudomycoides]
MKSIVQTGLLVLILDMTLFIPMYYLDGRIDVIETLILLPIALISGFYLITPLFLKVETINAIDNKFGTILELDFKNKKR